VLARPRHQGEDERCSACDHDGRDLSKVFHYDRVSRHMHKDPSRRAKKIGRLRIRLPGAGDAFAPLRRALRSKHPQVAAWAAVGDCASRSRLVAQRSTYRRGGWRQRAADESCSFNDALLLVVQCGPTTQGVQGWK
jgi:hypothetical protein